MTTVNIDPIDSTPTLAPARRRPRRTRGLMRFLTPARRVRLLLRYNRQFPVQLTLAQKVAAWRHGFTYQSQLLYELDQNDPTDYVRDFVSINYRREAPYRGALNDKLTMGSLVSSLGQRAPELYAFVRGGQPISLVPRGGEGRDSSMQPMSWTDLLELRRDLVFKPIDGGGGFGISLLRWVLSETGSKILTLNGQPVDLGAAIDQLKTLDGYLVTGLVEQSETARALFPGTVQTFRLLTLWDEQECAPFLAATTLTIGCSKSHVNNFKGGFGGLSAPIDQATGRLGRAATLDSRRSRVERYSHHPETGAPIEGVEIPDWEACRSSVLSLAAGLPHCPYVAWDAVPTDQGPVYIDANSPPGLFISQVHGGLLLDERVRRFFISYGMV